MKIYYLHLTEADFAQDDLVWTSDVIDLYNNDQYKNYSSTKSAYGLDSLGDRTWTGLAETGVNTTDSGEIVDGRFIDYTGRVDILEHTLTITSSQGDNIIPVLVDVYTSDLASGVFPNDFAQRDGINPNRSILWVNSSRYVKFVLRFDTEQDLDSLEFTYDVRVEIGSPVIDPLYARTQQILNKFPEWMALRDDSIPAATPELATPTALGSQLINAVAGEWLDKLDSDLEYIRLQRYITTADVNEVAWIYVGPVDAEVLYSITGEDEQLTACSNLIEFYAADEDDMVYWWDEAKQNVYTRIKYDSLKVNGQEVTTELQQVWNWFDEHGLIVDLYRHHGENNDSFRKRILDVYINRPGVALNNFKLALRRELNLWFAFDGSTPDSAALGATPTVLEISDIETSTEYVNPNGLPTQKFKDLVAQLAEQYPVTWGFFRWDKALWDIGGQEDTGFGVLPYQYDATPYPNDQTQSGIGDGSDLFVYRPDDITGPREFSYRFRIRGRARSIRSEYPEITAYIDLYAQADKTIYDNPTLEPWFTVIVETASETYYLPIKASVKSDVDNVNPSPTEASFYIYDAIGDDGLVSIDQTWYTSTGVALTGDEATPVDIPLETATSVKAQWGRFDPNTLDFTDYPANGSATMWFADDSATTVAANASDTQISEADPLHVAPIVIRSDTTDSAVGTWESDHQPRVVNLNGLLPDNSAVNTIFGTPTILWDPNLEATPNKTYVVEVTLIDSNGDRIVISKNPQTNENLELDHTILSVNGDNSWSGGKLYFDADTTSSFEFSSGTNGDYPVDVSVWTMFEAIEDDTHQAVVDENGPWRDGHPQEAGAYSFLLDQVDIGRDDFGLSSSDDYIITWIGPEVIDDTRVLIWIDCNTINPATDDDNEVVYPDNAIIEEYDSGVGNYVFSPFFVRTRMRPDIDPQWNPQVHSGWFYERQKEYYLYADPVTESATDSDWVLSDVARLGAPIIVKTDEATPVEYRQIAFVHDATPELVSYNTEVLYGNDSNTLYLGYDDVFDVTVKDLTLGVPVTASTYSTINEVTLSAASNRAHQYEVTYKVNNSFYADHEFIDDDEKNKTHISIVEATPFGGDFTITYEGSDYNPATPIDLPLNTFYTSLDEGFIFLSHDQYDLAYVEVRLSPSKLVADGEDYLLVSLRSFDVNFNMKPYQEFTVTTTFGTFEDTGTGTTTVTTNKDGFATAVLVADVSTTELSAFVEVDGPGLTDATVNYDIDPVRPRSYRLVALPSADSVQADGEHEVVIIGKVEDDTYHPVPYALVAWKRDRNLSAAFGDAYQGQVVADEKGMFSIGPFTSATPEDTGYWFLVAESWGYGASPSGDIATPDYGDPPYGSPDFGPVGDVVFWYEYPDSRFGVNDANELPLAPVQMQVNPFDVVYYSNQNAFPVTYDDDDPYGSATPVTLDYEAPKWYAIDRYTQYQLGLLGTGFYDVDISSYTDAPPDSKDV